MTVEAVHRDGDEAYVYVSGLTGWSRADVELGIENDTHVVVEGLEAGQLVALVDPTNGEDEGRPAADPQG